MVKFYVKEIIYKQKPIYKPSLFGMRMTYLSTEAKIKEKEIHNYIVDSEEKADLLVEAFTSVMTSAKKIELEDKLDEIEDKEK